MRGLHTSLVIVIAAIVILVVALVILTIFGVGITTVSTITDARSHCMTQAASTCQATRNLPVTWNSPSVMVDNLMISCSQATGYSSCNAVGGVAAADDYEPGERFYSGGYEGANVGIRLPEESIELARSNLQGGHAND